MQQVASHHVHADQCAPLPIVRLVAGEAFPRIQIAEPDRIVIEAVIASVIVQFLEPVPGALSRARYLRPFAGVPVLQALAERRNQPFKKAARRPAFASTCSRMNLNRVNSFTAFSSLHGRSAPSRTIGVHEITNLAR